MVTLIEETRAMRRDLTAALEKIARLELAGTQETSSGLEALRTATEQVATETRLSRSQGQRAGAR